MLISRKMLIFVDVVDYICDAKLVIIFEISYQILSKLRPRKCSFTIFNFLNSNNRESVLFI